MGQSHATCNAPQCFQKGRNEGPLSVRVKRAQIQNLHPTSPNSTCLGGLMIRQRRGSLVRPYPVSLFQWQLSLVCFNSWNSPRHLAHQKFHKVSQRCSFPPEHSGKGVTNERIARVSEPGLIPPGQRVDNGAGAREETEERRPAKIVTQDEEIGRGRAAGSGAFWAKSDDP